jgi:hypothetical protein
MIVCTHEETLIFLLAKTLFFPVFVKTGQLAGGFAISGLNSATLHERVLNRSLGQVARASAGILCINRREKEDEIMPYCTLISENRELVEGSDGEEGVLLQGRCEERGVDEQGG